MSFAIGIEGNRLFYLSEAESNTVDTLLERIKSLEYMMKTFQKDGRTLSDIRTIFYAVIDDRTILLTISILMQVFSIVKISVAKR